MRKLLCIQKEQLDWTFKYLKGRIALSHHLEDGMNLNGMDIWTDSLIMLYNLSGVVKFDPESGKQFKAPSSTLTYTQYFANALIAEAELDSKVVAIHAAMGGGTGLNYFQKHFPQRTFDVGIAEQHAVTFAAGLATEGIIPFCAIYSSFLQRGYDQVGVS